MLQIAAVGLAGFIALGSRWLLDGGIRKRERATIREEIELAALVRDDLQAARLIASAHARLSEYLRPRWWHRGSKTWAILGAGSFVVFGMASMAGMVLASNGTDKVWTSQAVVLVIAIAAGTVALLTAAEQWLRVRRIEKDVEEE